MLRQRHAIPLLEMYIKRKLTCFSLAGKFLYISSMKAAYVLLVLFISGISCSQHTDNRQHTTSDIEKYLDSAAEEGYPIKQRISFALKANFLLQPSHPDSLHYKCKKEIAILFLMNEQYDSS